MNTIVITLFAVLSLFWFLGKAADLAIYHIRQIAEKLGVGVFFLGLILGFFTSLPEFAIGINAVIDGIPSVAFGNLLGGLLTLYGLILGVSLLLNRRIEMGESVKRFALILIFLALPVLLSLDGKLGMIDGIVIAAAYFGLLFVLYEHKRDVRTTTQDIHRHAIMKDFMLFSVGIILVLIIANFIVDIIKPILVQLPISPFVMGLIFFAIGTNFPEIIVTFRAWKSHSKELAISNLLGSGMANVMILGVLAITQEFPVVRDASYYSFAVIVAGLLITLFVFYRSNKELTAREGMILIGIYGFFVLTQILATLI
ncbi:MAG: hypothetical protein V1652_02110 [bacterium]